MPTFYDSSGKPYELSIEIGRGGEGAVFYCPNDSGLVAKIYHEPIDEEKSEKLRWMAANRNDNLLKVAAWIVDTLHDKAGHTVGFIMPNVKAKEIHELYSLKSRRVHFPEATWQFLLHAATNIARAFYVLHRNDHIMGDVNHGNCVVLADGTVKLIDCDSYSIKTDKMRYRCDVGVATHLAPELQGVDLSEVEREKKHDNFGLAVIIFQLLFLGRHPFSGNYLGAEDKSLEDCIRERRFAYGSEAATNVKQPPGTLSLSQISPRLAVLFNRAFMTFERPEAREWIEGLEDLSDSLKQCSVHIGHHYFNGLIACPWCEIESKTGLLLFPFISGNNPDFPNEFNIFTVENLLASLEVPQNLPAKPLKPSTYPPPSTEAIEIFKQSRNRFIILAIVELMIVVAFAVVSPGCGFVLGIMVMTLALVTQYSFQKSDISGLTYQVEDARAGWNYFENEWQNYKKDKDFVFDVMSIRQKIDVYHSIQKEKQTQVKELEEANLQYQLNNYLSSFKLAGAGLRGIEEEHLRAFGRFGINTAADFNEARLNALVAIDSEKRNLLLRWRRHLEIKFEFDPKIQLPEVSKNNFEIEFANKRRKIEKEIEQLLVTLRSASTTLRQQQQQLITKAQGLAQTLAQAESNFSKVNNGVLMTMILVIIPIFVPLLTSMIHDASYSRNYGTTYNNQTRLTSTPKPVVFSSPSDLNIDPYFKVNEAITDKQIDEMSATEREKSARFLHQEALKLIETKDFKKAEKKLRLAVKFVGYYINIHYTLSSLLYDQKKYSESIIFLEKSLKIDPENENAKLLIGANYLKMKQYNEAEKTFLEVIEKNNESYEANFNLGLVYKNLNNFETAGIYFGKAVNVKPSEIEANYEYGAALCKSGLRSGAQVQYETLLNLDKTKAEKLKRMIDTEPVKEPNPPKLMIREEKP